MVIDIDTLAMFIVGVFFSTCAVADSAYTNHAGFCAKSEAALKSSLDKQVKAGVITPAERKTLK